MKDAISLADAIIKSDSSGDKATLTPCVQEYEEDMFQRAKQASAMTYEMMSLMFFTQGAPVAHLDRFVIAAMSDAVPWYVLPLLSRLASLYFWYLRRFGLTMRMGRKKAPVPVST